MKLTTERLKRLIQEELKKVEEANIPMQTISQADLDAAEPMLMMKRKAWPIDKKFMMKRINYQRDEALGKS